MSSWTCFFMDPGMSIGKLSSTVTVPSTAR